MKCVECGSEISTPTPDPFRCQKCRRGHEGVALCACDWVRLLPCPEHAALLTDAEAERLETLRLGVAAEAARLKKLAEDVRPNGAESTKPEAASQSLRGDIEKLRAKYHMQAIVAGQYSVDTGDNYSAGVAEACSDITKALDGLLVLLATVNA